MPKSSFYDWPWKSKWVSDVSNHHQSIGFDAGGHRYICVCGIVPEKGDSITIDNNNINVFEWTSEVNTLCINGFAEIVDANGRFGEVFSKYFCHMVLDIRKLTDDASRTDGWWEDTSISESVFRHVFIIDNAEIVRRTRQFVVYRIYLVGLEWYGLVQNRLFSNYAVRIPTTSKSSSMTNSIAEYIPQNFSTAVDYTSSGSKIPLLKGANRLADKIKAMAGKVNSKLGGKGTSSNEPVEIFSIIKSLLVSAFSNQKVYDAGNAPSVDDDSFTAHSSSIDTHVCFGYNHTILDSIKSLLGRLYQNEFEGSSIKHDTRLKMLVYDEFKNSYGVLFYGVDSSDFITGNKDTISIGTWESLFGSQFEALTEPVEQDMESVTLKSTTSLLKSFFTRVYHFFNIGGFGKKSIGYDNIIQYSYGDRSFKRDMKYQKYEARINKELFENFFNVDDPKTANYEVHGSSWNNEFSIYFDQVTNLIYKDVLVLHTKGDITHRPGMKYGIVSDAVVQNDDEQKSSDAKFSKKANKEIIGAFNVVKVSHIVKPNSRDKDNFTEKLYLSRNFMVTSSD